MGGGCTLSLLHWCICRWGCVGTLGSAVMLLVVYRHWTESPHGSTIAAAWGCGSIRESVCRTSIEPFVRKKTAMLTYELWPLASPTSPPSPKLMQFPWQQWPLTTFRHLHLLSIKWAVVFLPHSIWKKKKRCVLFLQILIVCIETKISQMEQENQNSNILHFGVVCKIIHFLYLQYFLCCIAATLLWAHQDPNG